MVIIKAKYVIKDGMLQDMIEEMKEKNIPERFKKQPGAVDFDFNVSLTDETNLSLVDIWADRTSFENHLHCDVTDDWTAVKAKYMETSSFDLYEGDVNEEYKQEILKK